MEKNKVTSIPLSPITKGLSGAAVLFDEMNFYLQTITGNSAEQFLLSPIHAKRLRNLIIKQVKSYETSYGEIIMKGSNPPDDHTSLKSFGFSS
ncbi:MAG: hypothetical protein V4519_02705 [Patescibacteria group bacterium]